MKIKTTLYVYETDPAQHASSVPVKYITYHIEAKSMKKLLSLQNQIIEYHHDKIVYHEGGNVV